MLIYVISIVGAQVFRRAYFGQGTGPIFIHRLTCAGSESSLLQCFWTAYYNTYGCSHSEDSGVRCEGILQSIIFSGRSRAHFICSVDP